MRRCLLVACVVLLGCGKDPGMNNPDPDPDAPPASDPDAAIPPGYTRLIGRTWSIPAPAKA